MERKRPGMTSGARMPHQGAPMGPPGPPYGGTPPIRPGMPNPALDPNRKRPAPTQPVQPPPVQNRPRKKPLGFPATNEISVRQMDMREAQSDPAIGSNVRFSASPGGEVWLGVDESDHEKVYSPEGCGFEYGQAFPAPKQSCSSALDLWSSRCP